MTAFDPPVWSVVGGVLLFAALVALLYGLCRAAAKPTPSPRSGEQASGVSALAAAGHQRCSVPFCDDPVQLQMHVGDEWWLFCMGHGTPYLTQDFKKEGAA